MNINKLSLILLATVLLNGCGGGGSIVVPDNPIAPPVAPPVAPVYTIDELTNGKSHSFSAVSHSITYTLLDGKLNSVNMGNNKIGSTTIAIKAGAGTAYNDGLSSIQAIDSDTGSNITIIDGNSGDHIDFSAPEMKRITAYNSDERINTHRRSVRSWDYQTFGFWSIYANGVAGNFSIGSTTHPSLIPTTGVATYDGEQFGALAWENGASIDVREIESDFFATANFDAKSLDIRTSNSRINPHDPDQYVSNIDNLSGALTYAPNTNLFSGAVTTNRGWSGNATGRFYGPNAEEIGGIIQAKGPGSLDLLLTGFGAKKN